MESGYLYYYSEMSNWFDGRFRRVNFRPGV